MSTNWQDNDQDDSSNEPDVVELLHHVVALYHKWRALAFVVGLTTLLTATALYMVAGAMQGYRAGRQGQTEPCLARPHEPLHQRMQCEVACEVRRRGAKKVSVVGAVPYDQLEAERAYREGAGCDPDFTRCHFGDAE